MLLGAKPSKNSFYRRVRNEDVVTKIMESAVNFRWNSASGAFSFLVTRVSPSRVVRYWNGKPNSCYILILKGSCPRGCGVIDKGLACNPRGLVAIPVVAKSK